MVFSIVSEGKDLEEVYFGKDGVLVRRQGAARSSSIARRSRSRIPPRIRDRLKEHGAEYRLRAGVRQRQGDQGRQAVVGRLRPGGRSQAVDAADRGVRAAGRVLRRRGRARAHLQDRAQRHARRRHREPDRDHAAGQQDGRAAPRLSRVHEQRRDGLDVHRATRRRRWSISTGRRPSRRSCCARISISASSSAARWTCRCR